METQWQEVGLAGLPCPSQLPALSPHFLWITLEVGV